MRMNYMTTKAIHNIKMTCAVSAKGAKVVFITYGHDIGEAVVKHWKI